jgi:hypothetical protein
MIKVKTGQLKPLTEKERVEDIEQLYSVLCENYPYFSLKKTKLGYDWIAHKDDFINWAKECLSNEDFYLTVKKIVTLVQNNHTELVNPWYREHLGMVYDGSDSWGKVLKDTGVIEKYEGWSEMRLPNPFMLPGEFKYCEGKYIYWSKGLSEHQKITGLKDGSVLEKISGIGVDKYVASLIESRYMHYDYKRSKPVVDSLRIYTEGIKTITLSFTDDSNIKFSIKLKSYKYYPNANASSENCFEEQGNIKAEVFEEGKTAYIKINSFATRHVKPDSLILDKLFIKFKDYLNLIIDVRGNGGGNEEYYIENIIPYIIAEKKSADFYIVFRHGEYIKSFLRDRGIRNIAKHKEIKSTEQLPEGFDISEEYRNNFGFFITNTRKISPSKYTGFKGGVFVLTDQRTYSAAETFAAFVKAAGIGVIAGITTGGDGVNIDPCLLALKNSGLVIRFAMSMGINSDGTINEDTHTSPDLYIEQSLKDFLNGIDTLLEHIRGLVEI